jgi:hypothetical protein
MASGDPRDTQFGLPLAGTVTQVQQASRDGVSTTVLNMQRLATQRITEHADDNHYINYVGPLYHE